MSTMSSPPAWRGTPDLVVDKVLRRVEVAKVEESLNLLHDYPAVPS